MEELTTEDLMGWEANRQTEPTIVNTTALTGTANQIGWAKQIKGRVGNEFDRVASVMRSVAAKQGDLDRTDTFGLVAILEEKRLEVMANERAGYFIHAWQELSDQVRQMLVRSKVRKDHAGNLGNRNPQRLGNVQFWTDMISGQPCRLQ